MDIITIPFESFLTFEMEGASIKVVAFKTMEHGNIKFGIEAPRSVKVNREEVHLELIKQRSKEEEIEAISETI